jgi:hypothetical protein
MLLIKKIRDNEKMKKDDLLRCKETGRPVRVLDVFESNAGMVAYCAYLAPFQVTNNLGQTYMANEGQFLESELEPLPADSLHYTSRHPQMLRHALGRLDAFVRDYVTEAPCSVEVVTSPDVFAHGSIAVSLRFKGPRGSAQEDIDVIKRQHEASINGLHEILGTRLFRMLGFPAQAV